jgi:predicted nucleotidyltransferase
MQSVLSPGLTRFRDALDQVYGDRVERVVLFGSRARGDPRPDSDYDVAVFLRDMDDRAAELNRLADLSTDILYDLGELIHAMPYRAGFWVERTPLMHEIRTDGVDL